MSDKLRLPPLNALRAFHAVARHKSLRQAADELFVTPQAVGQQIKLLEDALQVTLFERKGRSIEPTESAVLLAHYVEAGFNEFAEGVRRITRDAGSAYKINSKDVRARDVQMLFADASTGALGNLLEEEERDLIASEISKLPKRHALVLQLFFVEIETGRLQLGTMLSLAVLTVDSLQHARRSRAPRAIGDIV